MVESEKLEIEIIKCETHMIEKMKCTKTEKLICTSCILENKDEIKYYIENFDNIVPQSVDNSKNYLSSFNEYEGFELLNKVYLSYLENVENAVESSNEKIFIARELIKKTTKQILLNYYLRLTGNFEQTVKLVNSKITNLDINDLQSKEEFKKIKQSLDDQTEFLDSEQRLQTEFQKIIDGATRKFDRMKVGDFINEKFRFNIGKMGECLDLISCNGPIVVSSNTRGGSYWCVKSEESFSGEFKAKVKVHKMDTTKANNYWGYAVGIIRKNSTLVDNYYTDAICLQANGYLANKYTSSGSYKKLLPDKWAEGDEIIIKRDSKNNLYFGVNSEDNLYLAFDNITGDFRIVIGFVSTSKDDSFELTEIES